MSWAWFPLREEIASSVRKIKQRKVKGGSINPHAPSPCTQRGAESRPGLDEGIPGWVPVGSSTRSARTPAALLPIQGGPRAPAAHALQPRQEAAYSGIEGKARHGGCRGAFPALSPTPAQPWGMGPPPRPSCPTAGVGPGRGSSIHPPRAALGSGSGGQSSVPVPAAWLEAR